MQTFPKSYRMQLINRHLLIESIYIYLRKFFNVSPPPPPTTTTTASQPWFRLAKSLRHNQQKKNQFYLCWCCRWFLSLSLSSLAFVRVNAQAHRIPIGTGWLAGSLLLLPLLLCLKFKLPVVLKYFGRFILNRLSQLNTGPSMEYWVKSMLWREKKPAQANGKNFQHMKNQSSRKNKCLMPNRILEFQLLFTGTHSTHTRSRTHANTYLINGKKEMNEWTKTMTKSEHFRGEQCEWVRKIEKSHCADLPSARTDERSIEWSTFVC